MLTLFSNYTLSKIRLEIEQYPTILDAYSPAITSSYAFYFLEQVLSNVSSSDTASGTTIYAGQKTFITVEFKLNHENEYTIY